MSSFAVRLLDWFDQHGRHDLPWQHPRTPYRVWVAEIMLQQTQVGTVTPYFERFLKAFPDLATLADAPLDAVLAQWSGLGYYARARNLHAAARVCLAEHAAALPDSMPALQALPGIGRSTAAAILAQAHGQAQAILDGNVKRVLARLYAIEGFPNQPAVARGLWARAESLLPRTRLSDYTQALMDFGATLCTRRSPACARCPFQSECRAHIEGRVDALPTPRKPRRLPQRHCAMLLVRDRQHRVLLQRRAEHGVWGGLWSLPQFDSRSAAALWQKQHLAEARTSTVMPRTLRHSFTHFHLDIETLEFRLDHCVLRVGDNPQQAWFAQDEWRRLGLPQPIRKLLDESERE